LLSFLLVREFVAPRSQSGGQASLLLGGFISGGESLNGDVHIVSGRMQSAVVNVPVGIPVAFNLTLTVAGFGNPGSFGGDFIHSVDFPIGADVFALPDGFTVNDAARG